MGGEGDMAAPSLPSVGDGADESKVPADFVRKLFNMLEEPRYSNIVCWGPRKDSFIVLEQGRITKEILPNHFKHSNFASFVRQLNKYGFHKKKEDKDGGPPLHPPDVWEFSHPDFSWANRDSLDKIRRKVPASRKPQAASDDNGHAVAQVNLMAETMVATSLQIERLNELVNQLTTQNTHLFKELKQLQHAHQGTQQVNQQLLTWAFAQDELKLKNRHPMHSNHSGQFGALPDGNDEPSAELKKARELMNTFGMAPMAPNGYQDVNNNNMSMGHFQNQGDSPPDSTTGPTQLMFTSQPMPNSAIMPSAHAMMPNTFDNLVYPTGQNNGIDPFHPDRANNLPYPLQSQSQSQNVDPVIREGPDHGNGLWANGQSPRILLVEDDKTCSRIGSKFLSSVDCNVECAQDGEVATNKLNSDPERFDLIFMDIIMPKLDGISATIYIRTVNPHVPIIAMTSNIRAEDMATYYQWGMNDILAKPFTRDGMVKILKKYCGHMLKNPEAHAHELEPNGTAAPPFSAAPSASTPTFALSATNMKLETTPINSPATSTSWHSPGAMMQQASPNLETGGYMTTHVSAGGPQMSQMVKAQAPVGTMQAPPGGGGGGMPQQQQQQGNYGAPQLQNPNSARGHRMPDMGGEEKRQRLSYSAVHAPGNVPFTRR